MADLSIFVFRAAFGVILVALVLSFIRFLKGPTTADRVLALDIMTVTGIAVIVFIGFMGGRVIYIDVGLVYALLSFLSVIVIARYLEGGL